MTSEILGSSNVQPQVLPEQSQEVVALFEPKEGQCFSQSEGNPQQTQKNQEFHSHPSIGPQEGTNSIEQKYEVQILLTEQVQFYVKTIEDLVESLEKLIIVERCYKQIPILSEQRQWLIENLLSKNITLEDLLIQDHKKFWTMFSHAVVELRELLESKVISNLDYSVLSLHLDNIKAMVLCDIPDSFNGFYDLAQKTSIVGKWINCPHGCSHYELTEPVEIQCFYKLLLHLHRELGIFTFSSKCFADELAILLSKFDRPIVELCAGKGMMSASLIEASTSLQLTTTDYGLGKKKAWRNVELTELNAFTILCKDDLKNLYLVCSPPVQWLDALKQSKVKNIYLIIGEQIEKYLGENNSLHIQELFLSELPKNTPNTQVVLVMSNVTDEEFQVVKCLI
ncbi:hypothetical protein D5018_09335 [Parashewanella curva]|uniref:Uncharacterized protein n=1 Tax=Parashewanella curva TaxID=2338552 RepID=A0A3L8PX18_9GAMM|nr:hypothetical protein [Parashewanella curva]RLV59997.1 hypothetical protein D5018_09335 [Parashewanella curva]